jgi:hypothetical protein
MKSIAKPESRRIGELNRLFNSWRLCGFCVKTTVVGHSRGVHAKPLSRKVKQAREKGLEINGHDLCERRKSYRSSFYCDSRIIAVLRNQHDPYRTTRSTA